MMFGEHPYRAGPYDGADRSRSAGYKGLGGAQDVLGSREGNGWRRSSFFLRRAVLHEGADPQADAGSCDMITRSAEIPTYSSTWHRPTGTAISTWGIGHYGIVMPEKIAELKAAGRSGLRPTGRCAPIRRFALERSCRTTASSTGPTPTSSGSRLVDLRSPFGWHAHPPVGRAGPIVLGPLSQWGRVLAIRASRSVMPDWLVPYAWSKREGVEDYDTSICFAVW